MRLLHSQSSAFLHIRRISNTSLRPFSIILLLSVTALFFGAAQHAYGQDDALTVISPEDQVDGRFGASAAGIADINDDGSGDFIVGAPSEEDGEPGAGRAYVFDGTTGEILFTLRSPDPQELGSFGASVAAVGDVDDDGVEDILVGASGESGGEPSAGRAYVFSGATGTLLFSIESPNAEASGRFAFSVSGISDVDGDGHADIIIGAPDEAGEQTRTGRAYVFSGATGDLIYTLESGQSNEIGQFGLSVAAVPDADGDGHDEILIGAGNEQGAVGPDDEEKAGRAYLFSGNDGSLLHTFASPAADPGGSFGSAVSGVPDTNGDGFGDILIGAQLHTGVSSALDPDATWAGRAYLYSGDTGDLLQTLVSPRDQLRGFFGADVAGVDDVDGDGLGDLLVGATLEWGPGGTNGRAYVFSGADGLVIRDLLGEGVRGRFGQAVAGVPDADGDGRTDLLVAGNGRAFLFSGAPPEISEPGAPVVDPSLTMVSPERQTGGSFGSAVSGVPDVDGDGHEDVLVGAPGENGGETRSGRVHLLSGATGTVLLTLESPEPATNGDFGRAVAGVADVDGDGAGDLLVAERREPSGAKYTGRVYLFSGRSGELLHTLDTPNPQDDRNRNDELDGFGLALSGVPDVDGDGRGDFLVGASHEFKDGARYGRAYLFSGASGELLHTLESPGTQPSFFGRAVAGVPDADGDASEDLLVSGLEEVNGFSRGRVYLFSGSTGELLHTFSSDAESGNSFGWSIAGVPDVDGDDSGDVLIGAYREDGGAQMSGTAYVFSGASGELLHTLESPTPTTSTFFGIAVSGVPDADGDGYGDLLVGGRSITDEMEFGRAYLFSGHGGTLIREFASPGPGTSASFGWSVASFVDGDGAGGIIVAADSEGGAAESGRVYLYAGQSRVSSSPTPEPTRLALSVFPNPAPRSVTISIQASTDGAAHVELFDILGRQVIEPIAVPSADGHPSLSLDTSRLAAGVYLVRAVTHRGDSVTEMLTIVR